MLKLTPHMSGKNSEPDACLIPILVLHLFVIECIFQHYFDKKSVEI